MYLLSMPFQKDSAKVLKIAVSLWSFAKAHQMKALISRDLVYIKPKIFNANRSKVKINVA